MRISLTNTRVAQYLAIIRLVKRSNISIFSILTIAYSIMEAFGVSMIFPILRYMQSGTAIFEDNQLPAYWSVMLSWLNNIGLPLGLSTLLIITLLAVLFRQVFHILRQKYLSKMQAQFWYDVRSNAISSFMESDLSYLSNERRGALTSVITLEAHRAGDVLVSLLMIFGSCSLVVIYMIGLLLISPALVPIVPISVILAWVMVNKWLRLSLHYGSIASSGSDDLNSAVIERLFGIRLIKMFSREQTEAKHVSDISRRLGFAVAQLRSVRAYSDAIIEPIFFTGVFIILYLGVNYFNLSIASLGLFFVILLRMVPLAKEINNHRNGIAGSFASLQNIRATLAEATASKSVTSGDKAYQALQSHIEFKNVHFAYSIDRNQQNVLSDICFKIKKGTMTAIVGESGSGKSTLIDLLPRLHDPSSGIILLDGVPLRSYNLKTLRAAIGLVDQDVFLFNDTLFNNIAYGLDNTSSEAVKDAAVRAYADIFIMDQPSGYDTIVGDSGVKLSAGQRQRIGIARVMLQNPDIVILDEPTSALDSLSETYIQESLNSLKIDKTLVVVAHRLSTIQNADTIVVLENGHIVEQGTHTDLLKESKVYSRLFNLQIKDSF